MDTEKKQEEREKGGEKGLSSDKPGRRRKEPLKRLTAVLCETKLLLLLLVVSTGTRLLIIICVLKHSDKVEGLIQLLGMSKMGERRQPTNKKIRELVGL